MFILTLISQVNYVVFCETSFPKYQMGMVNVYHVNIPLSYNLKLSVWVMVESEHVKNKIQLLVLAFLMVVECKGTLQWFLEGHLS